MRLIDADELLNQFRDEPKMVNGQQRMGYAVGVGYLRDIIEAAPTITDKEVIAEFLKQGTFKIHIPEAEPFTEPVKTGKWLYNGSDGYNMLGEEFRWKKCSLCGYSYSTTLSKSHNYCPNCGAKMENKDGDDPSHTFADDVMMGDSTRR